MTPKSDIEIVKIDEVETCKTDESQIAKDIEGGGVRHETTTNTRKRQNEDVKTWNLGVQKVINLMKIDEKWRNATRGESQITKEGEQRPSTKTRCHKTRENDENNVQKWQNWQNWVSKLMKVVKGWERVWSKFIGGNLSEVSKSDNFVKMTKQKNEQTKHKNWWNLNRKVTRISNGESWRQNETKCPNRVPKSWKSSKLRVQMSKSGKSGNWTQARNAKVEMWDMKKSDKIDEKWQIWQNNDKITKMDEVETESDKNLQWWVMTPKRQNWQKRVQNHEISSK